MMLYNCKIGEYLRLNLCRLLLLAVPFLILAGCGSSKTAQEHLADAEILQQAGNWAGAILEYKNAVQLDPDNKKGRAGLGFAHLELGDLLAG